MDDTNEAAAANTATERGAAPAVPPDPANLAPSGRVRRDPEPQDQERKEVQGDHVRALSVRAMPGTYDEATREVDVVVTTAAPVRRYDWWEGRYYNEILVMAPEAVDMTRMNSGAPLLDSHQSYEIENVIGVVVENTARIEGDALVCRVRFSARDEVAPIIQDVRDGILRNISVGYSITRYEVDEETDPVTYRVTRWQPSEVSIVPIPADTNAGFRSAKALAVPPAVITTANNEGSNMTTQNPGTATEGGTEQRSNPPAVTLTAEDLSRAANEAAAAAVAAERKRVQDIKSIASALRNSGITDADAQTLVESGATVEAARSRLIDLSAERANATPTHSQTRVQVTTNVEARAAAMTNALLHRHDPNAYNLDDAARDFRGLSLMEMARDHLEAIGISTRGMSRNELAEIALRPNIGVRSGGLHSSSDFPILLANVANKTLRAAYQEVEQTFRPLVRVTSVPDFKEVSRMQLGEAPNLEKVNEHGEFKRGTVTEGQEKYSIKTYGKVLGITRQVIINDDLGAFTRVPAGMARAAARLEGDLVWGELLGTDGLGRVMGDGQKVFHSTHRNIAGSGGAIAVATVGAARTAMRTQKGLDGKTVISVTPSYLLVPTALETSTEQFLTAVTPNQTSQVVPASLRSLTPISDYRLDAISATRWYMAAGPGEIDTIELAYLDGNQGVYTETRTGFDVDGVEIKVRLDVGARIIDFRGFYTNAGA